MTLQVEFLEATSILQVNFERDSPIQVNFERDSPIQVDFGEICEVNAEDVPTYDGPCVVVPAFCTQVMDTAGLLMQEDVNIEQIPVSRISNNSGGTTVIIGG